MGMLINIHAQGEVYMLPWQSANEHKIISVKKTDVTLNKNGLHS